MLLLQTPTRRPSQSTPPATRPRRMISSPSRPCSKWESTPASGLGQGGELVGVDSGQCLARSTRGVGARRGGRWAGFGRGRWPPGQPQTTTHHPRACPRAADGGAGTMRCAAVAHDAAAVAARPHPPPPTTKPPPSAPRRHQESQGRRLPYHSGPADEHQAGERRWRGERWVGLGAGSRRGAGGPPSAHPASSRAQPPLYPSYPYFPPKEAGRHSGPVRGQGGEDGGRCEVPGRRLCVVVCCRRGACADRRGAAHLHGSGGCGRRAGWWHRDQGQKEGRQGDEVAALGCSCGGAALRLVLTPFPPHAPPTRPSPRYMANTGKPPRPAGGRAGGRWGEQAGGWAGGHERSRRPPHTFFSAPARPRSATPCASPPSCPSTRAARRER